VYIFKKEDDATEGMIAIAGAKGGCGKTLTSVGLAEAFARSGRPAVAIDADRQLPNLHTIGAVDREPTLGSLADGESVTDVAHQSPREPDAGFVTAPRSSQQVDIESTLDRIDDSSLQVVVDCPSGAGPDVVDPMAAADRVVVVTTGSKRSIEGAQTAIDLAERLDVPVEGAILNRCETFPETAEALDVPILAAVPEREDPLQAGHAQEAYETAVQRLLEGRAPLNSSERLSTGIEPLDRELGGGLPPGSVVALTADPNSQSELLLYELTTERGTLYLTTERSESLVRQDISNSVAEVGSPTIRRLDDQQPIEVTSELVRRLPEGANLVIDTMELLERTDRSTYVDFLNHLIEHIRETGSIAVLHCLRGASVPNNRSSTEHFADVVFDLQTTVDDSTVEQQLSIPKSRTDRVPAEAIELDLSTEPVIGARENSGLSR